MTTNTTKLRNQVKSRFYYLFWGAATLSVFAGQFYVGSGYRRMSESMDSISADINLLVEVLTYDEYEYEPQRDFYPDSMVIR